MARGGKRPGAGRRKGSKNKKVIEREQAAAAAAAAGLDPLQYVLDVMRNPKAKISRRDWAAGTALPYVRARLQSIQGDPDKPIIHEHRIAPMDAARRIAFVLFSVDRGITIDQPLEPKKVEV